MRQKTEHPLAKEKLLDAAEALAMEKGFVAASVEDICNQAKLSKGAFFHYFESKDELGKELLERYCARSKEAMRSGCCTQEKDPLKRIQGLLDFMSAMAKKAGTRGCLMGSMAQELSEIKPEIRSICEKNFSDLAKMLEKDLAQAKALYAPKASWNPKGVADHFVVVMQGAALLGKVRRDAKVGPHSVEHFKRYVEALLGR